MAIWVTVKTKKELPASSGVYVIRIGDRCLYVGKSHNLRKRFYLHDIERGRIAYKEFAGDRDQIEISYTLMPIVCLVPEELYYIELFEPEMNVRRR